MLYRVWVDHPESDFHGFLEDSYFVGPFLCYKYLEKLYSETTTDVEYRIESFQDILDRDLVTMVQAVETSRRANCNLNEALEALYERNGSCSLAVELITNRGLADLLTEDEAFPQWAKFKKWLIEYGNGKIKKNNYTPMNKTATWEDL
jgi:hypothetical protein